MFMDVINKLAGAKLGSALAWLKLGLRGKSLVTTVVSHSFLWNSLFNSTLVH
jgi:hypothetical protein